LVADFIVRGPRRSDLLDSEDLGRSVLVADRCLHGNYLTFPGNVL